MTSIFKFELKRNTKKTYAAALLIFMLICIIINHVSVVKHKSSIAKQYSFLELENKRLGKYKSYFELSKYGIMIIAVSDPLNILFCDSNVFHGDLVSLINSFERLELNNKQKGVNVFEKPTGGSLDFSWYIITIGSVIVLAFGWFSFRNKDFLKQLMASASTKPIIAHIVISTARLFILIVSITFITLISGIQMLIYGLMSNGVINGLLLFWLTSVVCMVPLFLVSAIMGTIRSKVIGVSVTVLFWFCLLFLWPKIQNSVLYQKADNIVEPIFNHELKKFDIMTDFENKYIEEIKKIKTIPERNKANIDWIERFWNNEFKELEKLESDMIRKIESCVKKFHFWSIFNPVTFYKSVNNELSSRGYVSYLSFYRDIQRKQRLFLRFYINKRFYENNPKVEPFLKDDEYIYQLKSSLPAYFLLGIIYNLLLIGLLYFISYFRFKRIIFPIEKKEAFSNLDLKLKKGKHYVYTYKTYDPNFPDQVFNVLMGKAGKFTGKISINGENIVTGEKKNFVYLPVPDALPGEMKVKSIINLLAGLFKIPNPEKEKIKGEFEEILKERFEKIKDIEKVNLMLRMSEFKKADIYLLNNFLIHIDQEETLAKIIDSIKKEDTLIIETNSINVFHEKLDRLCMIRLSEESKYYETKVTEQ